MLKKAAKTLFCGVLIASLLLGTSCATSQSTAIPESGGASSPSPADGKGGWVQHVFTPQNLPGDNINDILLWPDGTWVLTVQSRGPDVPSALCSTDNGQAWASIPNQCLQDFAGTLGAEQQLYATPLPDKSWYALTAAEPDYDALYDDVGNVLPADASARGAPVCLYRIQKDQPPVEIRLPVLDELTSSGATVQVYSMQQTTSGFAVIKAGSVQNPGTFLYITACAEGQISVLEVDAMQYMWAGEYLQNDTLYLLEKTGLLHSFSLADAAETSVWPVPGPADDVYSEFAFGISDDSEFCIVNRDGITCTPKGGQGPSVAITGSQYTFYSVEFSPLKLLPCNEGLLLLSYAGGSSKLHYYAYDENYTPDTQDVLTIWAMQDSYTLRAAVGAYSEAHPGTYVKVELGRTGQDASLTNEDIIRGLNAQLLGNSCPDVLILDDLPASGYAKNGILLDLTGLLDIENCYNTIMQAYCYNGKTYAYPGHFTMPICYVPAEYTPPASLADIAALCEEPHNFVFDNYTNMFALFYAGYSSRIFPQGAGVDEAALREFIYETGRIAAALSLTPHGETYYGGYGSMGYITPQSLGAMTENAARCAADTTLDVLDTAVAFSMAGPKKIYPLPGESYVPGFAGAIPMGAQNMKAAKQFLQLVLTDPTIQGDKLHEGLSVIKGSQQQTYDAYMSRLDDPAAPAPKLDWNRMIEGLRVPSITEAALRDIVFYHTALYYEGDATLSAAVEAVLQNTRLYFDERS